MKASKTRRPETWKTVKDLPTKNPQAVKGGIIINGTLSAIIDDGKYGSRVGMDDPEILSYKTR